MSTADSARAKLTIAARFPEHYFLENLAVMKDGAVLVTVLNKRELWYVPAPAGDVAVEPVLIDTLETLPMGIAETADDIFHVCTLGHMATIERYDFRKWKVGQPVQRTRAFTFSSPSAGLNGCCALGPNSLAIADCAAGLIWRADIAEDDSVTVREWLRHPSMATNDDLPRIPLTDTDDIPYPGVNGVRFSERLGSLFYTCSAKALFARVTVDPVSLNPIGDPKILFKDMGPVDDFCLDDVNGVAYIGTHVDHTVLQVPLADEKGATFEVAVGEPFDERMVGPSSLVWARGASDLGRTAYVATDGGHVVLPPDGILRPSALVRYEIEAA